mgnify:FL=1
MENKKKTLREHGVEYTYDERFLPLTQKEMQLKGWEQPDFVYVIGDAYVDHPSFGPAIISRVLEAHGYKVAIISQPDWKDENSIAIYGRPKLAFLVCAGNMDSMVNHYTVSKKRRHTDAYTPGGEMGKRPDYATIVYCNLIRKKYKDAAIVAGGIEASLRRLAHYDYWSNKLKHSILVDAQADIVIYGMGEHAIVEIADALQSGIDIKDLSFIHGTVYKARNLEHLYEDYIELPSYDALQEDKLNYVRSFKIQYDNTDHITAKILVEKYKDYQYVIQNPPAEPLMEQEMDEVYALPYTKTYHPIYEAQGGIPAISEIKFSLVSNRGCFGGCSFCALTFHQGRTLQTRSHASIIEEAKEMTKDPEFKGYIHDVGGPTANFRQRACKKQEKYGVCANRQCLFPKPCPNLIVDHSDYLKLLRELRSLPKVKKVFIRSGIRFDYLMADKDDTFFRELCKYHVSGQLKVAPEHISDKVLMKLGKPENAVFQAFCKKYKRINEELGLKQYMVPYLMSSHPGSTLKEAVELAEYLRDLGYMPEQVQDFYPTPSTISTCMYYTGVDPRTMEKVYVPNSPHEKAMQRALIQYRNPDNYDLVHEALVKAGRTDLIGFDKNCLIKPRKMKNAANEKKSQYGASNKQSGNRSNVQHKNSAQKQGQNQKQQMNTKNKKSIRNVHKKKQK